MNDFTKITASRFRRIQFLALLVIGLCASGIARTAEATHRKAPSREAAADNYINFMPRDHYVATPAQPPAKNNQGSLVFAVVTLLVFAFRRQILGAVAANQDWIDIKRASGSPKLQYAGGGSADDSFIYREIEKFQSKPVRETPVAKKPARRKEFKHGQTILKDTDGTNLWIINDEELAELESIAA